MTSCEIRFLTSLEGGDWSVVLVRVATKQTNETLAWGRGILHSQVFCFLLYAHLNLSIRSGNGFGILVSSDPRMNISDRKQAKFHPALFPNQPIHRWHTVAGSQCQLLQFAAPLCEAALRPLHPHMHFHPTTASSHPQVLSCEKTAKSRRKNGEMWNFNKAHRSQGLVYVPLVHDVWKKTKG